MISIGRHNQNSYELCKLVESLSFCTFFILWFPHLVVELLCGSQPYHPDTHMCCQWSVAPKVAGNRTECCGTTTYDPAEQICCANDHLGYLIKDGNTECCGLLAYDTNRAICCGHTVCWFLYLIIIWFIYDFTVKGLNMFGGK